MPRTIYPVTNVTAAGSSNLFTPAYLASGVVELWGAGGGGSTRTTNGGGGGGSGGNYSKRTLIQGSTINPMTSYTLVVGAGQAPGSSTPGHSTFDSTTVTASGGTSVAANTATGASSPGTVGMVGDVLHQGGAGGLGVTGDGGGGGGEGAGSDSNGNPGADANAAGNGAGGTGVADGGDGGTGKQSPQGNGTGGTAPGGAGGGGYRSSSGTRTGGTGGAGRAQYQWFVDRKDHMLMLGCG